MTDEHEHEHEHAMKVAKVIAKTMGDNFSDAFKNKQRWTAKRGMSGGRFRDVNEPFQDDYIAAAQAAAAVIAADRAGLVARVAELEKLARTVRDFLLTAPLESGVCCCGDPVEGHGYGSGHSPVDDLAYYAGNLANEISDALKDTRHEHG